MAQVKLGVAKLSWRLFEKNVLESVSSQAHVQLICCQLTIGVDN